MNRSEILLNWLRAVGGILPDTLVPASSDASFRRYFRVQTAADAAPGQGWAPGTSLIVMDAPPPREDCHPFVHVAGLLHQGGLLAPQVLAADLAQGFLLLSDLGPDTLLDRLQAGSTADPLYRTALRDLCRLQAITPANLPAYDLDRLRTEIELFPAWYLDRHLQRPLDTSAQHVWNTCTDTLLAACLRQPQVLVHRDYHSRNLMVPPTAAGAPEQLGILDFQDAVRGPITYDLVSLLRDAYIDFPEDVQVDWLVRWWQTARNAGLPVPEDFGELYRDFEWMGVQRHLKVLGIFARLNYRDGKPGYLSSMPRVLAYLQAACERYVELRPLSRLLAQQHDALRQGMSF